MLGPDSPAAPTTTCLTAGTCADQSQLWSQAREGHWTPVNAVLAAAVAEVDRVGNPGHLVVHFALGSISQRTYRGLAFYR